MRARKQPFLGVGYLGNGATNVVMPITVMRIAVSRRCRSRTEVYSALRDVFL